MCIAASGGVGHAQDALRGKRLYLDAAREVGSGVSCVDCHSGLPGGLFGIGRAANDPARIAQAIDSVPPMAPFRGLLGEADRADLAAYLGDPLVPSPQLTVQVIRGEGGEARGDRVDFGTVLAGAVAAEATVELRNSGPLALTILGAPEILGDDEVGLRAFALASTDCTAGLRLESQQACRLALRFLATGSDGARVARLRVEHDWVGGAAALALLGKVGDPAAPGEPGGMEPGESEGSSSGCRGSRGDPDEGVEWSALLGLFAVGWRRRRRCGSSRAAHRRAVR